MLPLLWLDVDFPASPLRHDPLRGLCRTCSYRGRKLGVGLVPCPSFLCLFLPFQILWISDLFPCVSSTPSFYASYVTIAAFPWFRSGTSVFLRSLLWVEMDFTVCLTLSSEGWVFACYWFWLALIPNLWNKLPGGLSIVTLATSPGVSPLSPYTPCIAWLLPESAMCTSLVRIDFSGCRNLKALDKE